MTTLHAEKLPAPCGATVAYQRAHPEHGSGRSTQGGPHTWAGRPPAIPTPLACDLRPVAARIIEQPMHRCEGRRYAFLLRGPEHHTLPFCCTIDLSDYAVPIFGLNRAGWKGQWRVMVVACPVDPGCAFHEAPALESTFRELREDELAPSICSTSTGNYNDNDATTTSAASASFSPSSSSSSSSSSSPYPCANTDARAPTLRTPRTTFMTTAPIPNVPPRTAEGYVLDLTRRRLDVRLFPTARERTIGQPFVYRLAIHLSGCSHYLEAHSVQVSFAPRGRTMEAAIEMAKASFGGPTKGRIYGDETIERLFRAVSVDELGDLPTKVLGRCHPLSVGPVSAKHVGWLLDWFASASRTIADCPALAGRGLVHGFTTRSAAEEKLGRAGAGSYMLRIGSASPGGLVLSVAGRSGFYHIAMGMPLRSANPSEGGSGERCPHVDVCDRQRQVLETIGLPWMKRLVCPDGALLPTEAVVMMLWAEGVALQTNPTV